jgi:hypothetical protein
VKLRPEPDLIKRWLAIVVLLSFTSHSFVFLCQESDKATEQIIKAAQVYQETSAEVHSSVDVALPKVCHDSLSKHHGLFTAVLGLSLADLHEAVTHPIFIHVTTHAP